MVSIAACAPDEDATVAQSVEGVIRNYETGKPIPDAFVVARWFVESGGLGHGGGAICFHVEVMKTDAQGSYRFPISNIRSDYADVSKPDIFVVAYKPGYRWALLRNIESIQIGGEAAYEKYEERMRGLR